MTTHRNTRRGQTSLRSDQAEVLAILDSADGIPVSFAALEARGVSRPAMLVYELEVTGYAIDRVFEPRPGGRRQLVGIRRGQAA